MLQTYEAVLQPDWGLEFSCLTPPRFDRAQKVLVTVLQDDAQAAATQVPLPVSTGGNVAIDRAQALRRVFPLHDPADINQEFQAQRDGWNR
jgi:hypothetical protein